MPETYRATPVIAPSRDASAIEAVRRSHADTDRWLEDEIGFNRYLRTFTTRWKLLALGLLLGGAIGVGMSQMRPRIYEGVTTLAVIPPANAETRVANVATFRALLENLTLSSQVIDELGLKAPPHRLTPHLFMQTALQIEELRTTNLVRVRVKLRDPHLAAEASRRLAHRAIALNRQISRQEAVSLRDELKIHLDESLGRLDAAEQQLLAYQTEAQLDLLRKDTDALLQERGELLRLLIGIESEKARLTAAEREIAKQPRVLSSARSVSAEEALRRAAEVEDTSDRNPVFGSPSRSTATRDRPGDSRMAPPADPLTVDVSNPYINPVYQTLELQIATSRSRLAALEEQRREMVDVKKIGGRELAELTNLYRRQTELARRQTTFDLARRVYTELAVRYEEARTQTIGNSALLQVVDSAIPPDRPLSRNTLKLGLVCSFAALAVAALAAIALDGREQRSV